MSKEKLIKYLIIIIGILLLINLYTIFTLKKDTGYIKSDVADIWYKIM